MTFFAAFMDELTKCAAEKPVRHVFVTGPPGSGKTTYAKKLSKKLGLPMVSLDGVKGMTHVDVTSKLVKTFVKKNLDTPHVIEGVQLMGVDPQYFKGHTLKKMNTPRDVAINRMLQRGFEPTPGRLLRGRKHRREAEKFMRTFDKLSSAIRSAFMDELTKCAGKPQYGRLGFEKLPEGYFKHLKANLRVATAKSKKGVKTHRVMHALHGVIPHRRTSHETYEKKAESIYHGSPKRLKTIEPMNLHGDPDVDKAVFGSPSRAFALAYAGGKWDDRHIGQSTHGDEMHIVEMGPGAFEQRFKDKKGYLYSFAPGPQWTEREGGVRIELVSKESQTPTARERVHAYDELMGDPKFKLFKFDPKSKQFRQQIRVRKRRMAKMTPKNRAQYMKWLKSEAHPEVTTALESHQ